MKTIRLPGSNFGAVAVALVLSGCGSPAPAVESGTDASGDFRIDSELVRALVAQNGRPVDSCLPEILRAVADAATRSGRNGMALRLDEHFQSRFSGTCFVRERSPTPTEELP